MEKLKPFIPLLVLAALCVAIGLISPRFLTLANLVRVSAGAAVPLCKMSSAVL